METIRIKCPNCSAILETLDNPANYERSVICPNCKTKTRFKDFKRVVPRSQEPVQEDDHTQIDAFKKDDGPGYLLDMTTYREYPLKEGHNLIGRKPANSPDKADIPIITKDLGMSRQHLFIDVIRGYDGFYHAYAYNANNKNATQINGNVLEDGDKVGLCHGDIIQLCDTPLKFVSRALDCETEL